MKSNLSLLFSFSLLLASNSVALAHAGHQAFYYIEHTENKLILRTKFELSDISEAMNEEQSCEEDAILSWCAAQYLKVHFTCLVNGQETTTEMESSKVIEGYLLMNFSLQSAPETITAITIQNSLFVCYDPNYENIVSLDINGATVSYEMNNYRTSITHNFKNQSE